MSGLPNFKNWSKVILAVTTPLGFLTLIVLISVSILLAAASSTNIPDRFFYSVMAMLVLLIVVVAVFAWVKPEALKGERIQSVTPELGTMLGIEVYTAFDGYIKVQDRLEAYGMFRELCIGRVEGLNDPSKKVVKAFVESVKNGSKLFEKAVPKGRVETPSA